MTPLADDYAGARARFLEAVAGAGGVVDSITNPNAGRDGEELAVDIADFGPAEATSGILVVSGTHGVEGFCGSALQSNLIETWGRDRSNSRDGWNGKRRLVMVHALNPVGFSWVRRVNEDNVDLNRNFIEWSEPPPINPGYDAIADLLVPRDWSVEEQERTTGLLLEHAMSIGLETMQRDVSGGQFNHEAGVFYGGAGPAWSNRLLRNELVRRLGSLEDLRVIDLHTGLGEWATGELISSYRPGDAGFVRATALWGAVTSMHDGSSASAPLTGDWLDAIEHWLPDAVVTAAALEFGTVDTVSVLQALRADAWLHAYGDPTGPGGAATRAQVRAAFLDDDPSWLRAVGEQFTQVFEQAR